MTTRGPITAMWMNRESTRSELDGYKLQSWTGHMPHATGVTITMVATRELGRRLFRVTEDIALDVALHPEVYERCMTDLEGRMAEVVAAYDAEHPVEPEPAA